MDSRFLPNAYTVPSITSDEFGGVYSSDPHRQKAMDCWLETASGKRLYLIDPLGIMGTTGIELDDIIKGMAHEPQFASQTKDLRRRPSTVGQHSLLVWSLGIHAYDARESDHDFMLGLLLHDASEAYLHNLPAPLKQLLRHLGGGWSAYDLIQEDLQRRILERFEVTLSNENLHQIKACDRMALFIESYYQMHSQGIGWKANTEFLESSAYDNDFSDFDFPRCLGNVQNKLRELKYNPFDTTCHTSGDTILWLTRAFQLYGVDNNTPHPG